MTDPELVARAQHELRGAATALALACETLRRDSAASDHAAVIDAQLDRLRAGLEDLEAARSEAAQGGTRCRPEEGGARGSVEPVDLPGLARAAAEPWIGGGFEWEGPPLTTDLDRRRFAKAIGNLLANAAEHGSGDIRVTGRAHDGGVRLQVTNRGRGLLIASEAAEELGGSLRFEIAGDTAIATLDLPAG